MLRITEERSFPNNLSLPPSLSLPPPWVGGWVCVCVGVCVFLCVGARARSICTRVHLLMLIPMAEVGCSVTLPLTPWS